MKNAEEILQWLLEFVEFDLRHLRPGDWLNLREDVMAFLDWAPSREPHITREGLLVVQAEVKKALLAIDNNFNDPKLLPIPERQESVGIRTYRRGMVNAGASSDLMEQLGVGIRPHRRSRQTVDVQKYGIGKEAAPVLSFKTTTVSAVAGILTGPDGLQIHVRADLRTEFLVAVLNVLAHVDIGYIRQCPACQRIFYAAHGRQIFCTPQCASRAGTQRFREKHRTGE